jgi:hypothetical protein
LVIGAHGEGEIDPAFATLVKQGAGAVLISSDALFTGCRDQIVVLAARHALPTIYTLREYAMAGGLMSYGPNLADAYRHAGVYAGRILKGEKPCADSSQRQLNGRGQNEPQVIRGLDALRSDEGMRLRGAIRCDDLGQPTSR